METLGVELISHLMPQVWIKASCLMLKPQNRVCWCLAMKDLYIKGIHILLGIMKDAFVSLNVRMTL